VRGLGKTIFLSSHILTELADICTSVAIMERGRLVVAGPIGEIADKLGMRAAQAALAPQVSPGPGEQTPGGEPVPAVALRRVKLRVIGDAAQLFPLLQGAAGLRNLEVVGQNQALLTFAGDERWVAEMVRHLVMNNVPLVGVEPERTELERIFLEATRGDLQ
jgi:ABC-2 type transport system ATP-binding protein